MRAANVVTIPVLDHIIVTRDVDVTIRCPSRVGWGCRPCPGKSSSGGALAALGDAAIGSRAMRGELRVEPEACSYALTLVLTLAVGLAGCVLSVPPPTSEAIRVSGLCPMPPSERSSPAMRTPHAFADSSWDKCPFPKAAEPWRIDEAAVMLRVTVTATGAAQNATVLCDPGYGFAEIARDCALGHKYVPAQDEHGNIVAGTMRVRVHFSR
jgi:hypothetical protein